MNDIEFAEKMNDLVDAPYALGDPDGGYDCLTILDKFSKIMGTTIPQEFKGFNRENYVKRYLNGEGAKEMLEYLLSLGEPVRKNFERLGDLFIYERKEIVGVGIYLGSGNVLTVTTKGIKVVSVDALDKLFNRIAVRRLV
jgi:hypothetical protein